MYNFYLIFRQIFLNYNYFTAIINHKMRGWFQYRRDPDKSYLVSCATPDPILAIVD